MFKQGNCRYQTLCVVCNPPFMVNVQRLQSSICLSCACRCMDQFNLQFIGVLRLSGTFPPFSPGHNTLFLGPSPLIIPNSISSGSAIFVWVSNVSCTMHCQWGRKPPKLPLPLRILSPCRSRTEPRP